MHQVSVIFIISNGETASNTSDILWVSLLCRTDLLKT